jgi:hypothetical protein
MITEKCDMPGMIIWLGSARMNPSPGASDRTLPQTVIAHGTRWQRAAF